MNTCPRTTSLNVLWQSPVHPRIQGNLTCVIARHPPAASLSPQTSEHEIDEIRHVDLLAFIHIKRYICDAILKCTRHRRARIGFAYFPTMPPHPHKAHTDNSQFHNLGRSSCMCGLHSALAPMRPLPTYTGWISFKIQNSGLENDVTDGRILQTCSGSQFRLGSNSSDHHSKHLVHEAVTAMCANPVWHRNIATYIVSS